MAMKIDTSRLDYDLKKFINLLRINDMNNVIIVGGLVRDLVMNNRYKDIDIAFRLNMISPSSIELYSPINKYEIPLIIQKDVYKLSELLNCNINDFIYKESISFGNTSINILGLVLVKDTFGNILPDIFIDSNNKIFGAYSELTYNRLALDLEGNIWPDDYIKHLKENVGYLTDGLLGIDLYRILRIIRISELLNTKLDLCVIVKILDYLKELNTVNRFMSELEDHRV
ncbi:hypothetical protein TI05_16780 [Achromatium sp. WMS3]|nr:hypothetical protein TI05_16780 [Achromatium sp. WMS3]